MKCSLNINEATSLPSRFILLSNHQSLADIPLLISSFPKHSFKFVAKKSLRYGIPTLSKCLRYGKHGFVDRKRPSVRTRRELIRLGNLDETNDNNYHSTGCSFIVFPEGTRSRTGKVLSFYRAGLRLLCETTNLPVAVVALDCGGRTASLLSLLNCKNIHYRMKLLNVYPPPSSRNKVDSLLNQARKDIKAQIHIWRKRIVQTTNDQQLQR